MTLSQKLEILIKRKGMTKTEVATIAGITYRAFANYISGERKPKKEILNKIATILDTTPEFLADDKKGLILTSSERFVLNSSSPETAINTAINLLEGVDKIFKHGKSDSKTTLTKVDKRALFACIIESYFSEDDGESGEH